MSSIGYLLNGLHSIFGLEERADEAVPSPETIKAVVDLLKSVTRKEPSSLLSYDHLQGLIEIIRSVIWPIVVVIVLFMFKDELRKLIGRIKKVTIGGSGIETAEDEIKSKIEDSAAAVLSTPTLESNLSISAEQIRASVEVATLSGGVGSDAIHLQMESIAAEYEGVRANMPSGRERTRKMAAVMAKMRTLGRAVYPFRQELKDSPSPGKRLFAIASLQMLPDYNMVQWLASATKTEVPFIQFQALSAIQVAVRNAGPARKMILLQAIEDAKTGLYPDDPDQSRWNLLRSIEGELKKLPDQ